MKRVLIISYCFPPGNGVGGQRPYRLAKYFPKYRIEPIVLTVKLPGKLPEGLNVIQTNYKDVTSILKSKFRFSPQQSMNEQLSITINKNHNYLSLRSKIFKLLKEIIIFPDVNKGWYKYALNSASEFLDKEMVDVIISTSPPIVSHLIARKLKRKYQIPWIADLRDPWTHLYDNTRSGLFSYFERRLALKTLSDSDAVVTVTNPYLENIKAFLKGKQIFCIANGYDPDDFSESNSKLTSKFTITYTGYLYHGKRDPSLLFRAVSQLIDENKLNRDMIEIKFYSARQDWLVDEIDKYNLSGIVNICDLLPRDEILKIQRESQLLFLIRWDAKIDMGDCPAKIFEYLVARRPVVAIGGCGGIVKNILEDTNAGRFAENLEVLKSILIEYYQEFIKYGKIECHTNSNIENFNYVSITEKYSKVLNTVLLK